MKKNDLLHKLKDLEGLSPDERAYLIDLVNTRKKYGLLWEDKPEDMEQQLRSQLPVLQEVAEKRILGRDLPAPVSDTPQLFEAQSPDPATYPNHVLIEGDNLHALTALTFTHEGKIDLIYIDPPYNTGNKDFKYNDTYVDREDSYRHSKWLSFMHKRLQLAKRLLSDQGVIFISIDDNEQAQLKLLCDEVFGEGNFIANVIWQKRISPDARRILGPAHDNIYCYGKTDIGYTKLNYLALSEEQERAFRNPDDDPRGPWVSSDFTAQGYRPNQMYQIVTPGGSRYSPPEGRCWLNVESVFEKQSKEGRIWFGTDGKSMPRRKTYLSEREGSVPWTWWDYKSSGNNQDAKKEIIAILGNSTAFATPKPIKLLEKILTIGSQPASTILDFFAGSGTTLHATMQLNAEDGGQRQCILVTNNENNICEEVTYARNRRVIGGYTNGKGQSVAGLRHNNLRYYRSAFVDRSPSLHNKKALTRLATELLCIKENCYTECAAAITDQHLPWYGLYTDEKGQYLSVTYDDARIEETVEILQQLIGQENPPAPVKVYVFSNGPYAYSEEFEEILDRVTLCALPDAIYKAYQHVLPRKQRPQAVSESEENPAQMRLFDEKND